MRARLQSREWGLLISLIVMFFVLITIAYSTKDRVDPSIQNFFNGEKIQEVGNFDCTK
jgi:hypothetical protein